MSRRVQGRPVRGRQRLPGRTSRWLFFSQAGVAVSFSSRALSSHGWLARALWGLACGAELALLGLSWMLDKTSFDGHGVRFSGHLRRRPWQQVTAGWTTSSPPRRGQVAFELTGRPQPVWVQDPDERVLTAWSAATGRPPARYGYYNSDNPAPSR